MLLSAAIVAFGLAWAQIVTSKVIHSRQEQCNSAQNSAAYSACAMQAAFGGSSIIPKLIPAFSPKAALSVTYGNVVIGGAQQLSPARVFAPPFLSLSFISNSSQAFQQLYIVLGLNYELQSGDISPFWLQSDVQIDGNTGVMSSSIPPIVPYDSPNPEAGTGTHEFIFFVFADNGLLALFRQKPEPLFLYSVATLQTFLTNPKVINQLVAGSYFKSTYDGATINGQTPAALAALESQGTGATSQSSTSSASKTVTSQKQVTNQVMPTITPVPPPTSATPPPAGKGSAQVQVAAPPLTTASSGSNRSSSNSGLNVTNQTNSVTKSSSKTNTIAGTTASPGNKTTTGGQESDQPEENQSASLASLVTQNYFNALMPILLASLFLL